MKYDRRKWLAVVLLTVTALDATADISGKGVTPARNLDKEGQQAEGACIPLLLEFSSIHCEYCTRLEEEILNPTLLNRDYDRRVLMRKLVVDNATRLRDFDGRPVYAAELASRYKVFVTPTLLFVDSRGEVLADRMVGVTTLEFYGGYLDQALDNSTIKLKDLKRCQD